MKVRRIHHKNRKSPFWYEMRLQVLISKTLDRDDEEWRKKPSHGESRIYDPEIGEWLTLSEYNRITGKNLKEYDYGI